MEHSSRPPEFVVRHPEKLVDFYEKVLGYKALIQDSESGRWSMLTSHRQDSSEGVRSWQELREIHDTEQSPLLGSFEVADMDRTIELVKENGGDFYLQFDDPVTRLATGRQAFFVDPEGNLFSTVEYLHSY